MATVVDHLVQTSAIHAMNPADGSFAASGTEQVAQVFANAEAVMAAAGGSLDDVIGVEVLLSDDSLREPLNERWEVAFPDPGSRPIRHTTVLALRDPLRIQLKLTAHLAEDSA